MKLSLLALVLLMGSALAGCSGDPTPPTTPPIGPKPFDPAVLSPKSLGALAPEEVWVAAASDGVMLQNALYRPDTDEKVPVFINFSPYWGDTAMTRGDPFAQYLIDEYVPRGYAVVLAALRGTGHSGGCFQIGSDVEVADAYDVIDHFANAEWSNGNVAAGGKSYDSTTQNGVIAKKPHPALKGIFHVSGITDMYRYNAKDGVVYANGLEFTPRYFVTQGFDEYLGVTNGAGSAADESPESLLRLLGDVTCPEALRHVASGEGTAADGMRDAYWQERDWPTAMRESSWNGSVFFVHGLQDWNVKPDHIEPWLAILREKGIPVLGWLHQWSQAGTGHVYPMRTDWNETMLRWLDGTLKGVDTRLDQLWGFDIQAPGKDGIWRHSAVWPPVVEQWATMEVGPDNSANTLGPVDEARRFSGIPYATVTVTPSSADGVLIVHLYDKDAGGQLAWINGAVRRLALSDDLQSPSPYTPGMPLAVNITFYPMEHVLLPGHALVVDLAAGTPQGLAGESTNANFVYRPDQTTHVAFGGATLFLPEATLDGVLVPQPEPMKCFTC